MLEKSTIYVRVCILLTCRNLFLFVIASFESPLGALMGETRWYINGIGLFLSPASIVSLAAVFWMSRNAPPSCGGALRDIQKTAAWETTACRVLTQKNFVQGRFVLTEV